MNRSRPLVALVLVISFAASAATARGVGIALTPAAYRQQATTICKQWAQSAAPLPKYHPGPALLAVTRTYLSALRRLSPPTAFAPLHGQILVLVKAINDRLAALVAGYASGKMTPSEELGHYNALNRLSSQEGVIWQKLGVPFCRRSGA
jgi:hypothetical protein